MTDHDILILGVGSPFGADRAGWEAVELLRETGGLEGVRFETSDRPGARLLSMLEGVWNAIIIDALLCSAPPGTPLRIDPWTLAPGERSSNHGFGVADALALGRALGALPPRLSVIGISAEGNRVPTIDGPALTGLVRSILQENGDRGR